MKMTCCNGCGACDRTRHLLDTEYPGARFRSYAIVSNTALLPDYIGCCKGPRSARIIADIDRMLRVRHLKDPAQEVYDRWLDPADQAVLHRAIAEAERNEGE